MAKLWSGQSDQQIVIKQISGRSRRPCQFAPCREAPGNQRLSNDPPACLLARRNHWNQRPAALVWYFPPKHVFNHGLDAGMLF
jgi:hypothetical protein